MSKPKWEDAPECARWLTCDQDGWYWWEFEPRESWHNGMWEHGLQDGHMLRAAELPKKSKEPRP